MEYMAVLKYQTHSSIRHQEFANEVSPDGDRGILACQVSNHHFRVDPTASRTMMMISAWFAECRIGSAVVSSNNVTVV